MGSQAQARWASKRTSNSNLSHGGHVCRHCSNGETAKDIEPEKKNSHEVLIAPIRRINLGDLG